MEVGVTTLSPSEVVLIIGIAVVILRELADVRGWLPSTKRIRQENADLVRREAVLVEERDELRNAVESLRTEVKLLEGRVEQLQRTDQAAVLEAISLHERAAVERSHELRESTGELAGILREIRDALSQVKVSS